MLKLILVFAAGFALAAYVPSTVTAVRSVLP